MKLIHLFIGCGSHTRGAIERWPKRMMNKNKRHTNHFEYGRYSNDKVINYKFISNLSRHHAPSVMCNRELCVHIVLQSRTKTFPVVRCSFIQHVWIWNIVCLLLFNGGAHNVLFKHSDAQVAQVSQSRRFWVCWSMLSDKIPVKSTYNPTVSDLAVREQAKRWDHFNAW